MPHRPKEIATLGEQSTDEEIVAAIRSILKDCDGIVEVVRLRNFELGGSRHFQIDLERSKSRTKVIDLLGRQSDSCAPFATRSVLLKIND